MGIQKYQTEEERLEARRKQLRESQKRWREQHPEQNRESSKRWTKAHPDYQKEYYKTPIGRATNLISSYQQSDKKFNRGECTLTAQWVVENIFSKPCNYNCGETDWTKLGCDRIDNSLPHTPDNVVPCCDECNKKRGTKTYEEFLMSLKNEQPN